MCPTFNLFFVQLWRVHDKTPSPKLLAGHHASNIFCLDFDPTNPSR